MDHQGSRSQLDEVGLVERVHERVEVGPEQREQFGVGDVAGEGRVQVGEVHAAVHGCQERLGAGHTHQQLHGLGDSRDARAGIPGTQTSLQLTKTRLISGMQSEVFAQGETLQGLIIMVGAVGSGILNNSCKKAFQKKII